MTNNVYLAFAEKYHSIDKLENWLLKVLFLTFIRWYKQSRKNNTLELDENISTLDDVEQNPHTIDAGKAVIILKTFSEEKQEIVRLRIWGDLKFSEIAEQLNKTEFAVKKMFYRTLDEIKDKLD